MRRNAAIVLAVLALAVIPFFLPGRGGGERFAGADQQAEQVIREIRPGYRPWFRPLWEPPSAEVESLLFAVQAAMGAGLVGYWLGFARGRAQAARGGIPCGQAGEGPAGAPGRGAGAGGRADRARAGEERARGREDRAHAPD